MNGVKRFIGLAGLLLSGVATVVLGADKLAEPPQSLAPQMNPLVDPFDAPPCAHEDEATVPADRVTPRMNEARIWLARGEPQRAKPILERVAANSFSKCQLEAKALLRVQSLPKGSHCGPSLAKAFDFKVSSLSSVGKRDLAAVFAILQDFADKTSAHSFGNNSPEFLRDYDGWLKHLMSLQGSMPSEIRDFHYYVEQGIDLQRRYAAAMQDETLRKNPPANILRESRESFARAYVVLLPELQKDPQKNISAAYDLLREASGYPPATCIEGGNK